MDFKNKIYNKSPIWTQNLLVSLQGYYIKKTRFNKKFKKLLLFFENNNPEEVNNNALSKFLKYASTSLFWQNKFRKYNVNIFADDLISELQKLPILTKTEVQKNVEEIRVSNVKESIKSINTSGTTGAGLVFQQTQSMENKQWAVWWRYRRRHGIKFDTWMGWFGGRTLMDVNIKEPPFWRVNYPGKQVMFSAYHLNQNTVKYYVDEIISRKLKWLHGYPSQLSLLASLIKDNGFKTEELKMNFITTGAENLLSYQKNIIMEVFGVMPLQHYGLAEGVANISELPSGELQIDQDFAFVELIPSGFSDNTYKIIGTNYSNVAFPLIRYDTNDLVNVKFEKNKIKILSINGRNEDYISLPNGVKIGRLDHIFKKATFIKEAQFYQDNLNYVKLKIVKNNSFIKEVHEPFILKECALRFGNEVSVKIEYVNEINKTKSGKLKFVISELT